jgi:hypothetical protein
MVMALAGYERDADGEWHKVREALVSEELARELIRVAAGES